MTTPVSSDAGEAPWPDAQPPPPFDGWRATLGCVAPADTIVCVYCGGDCRRSPDLAPKEGWRSGDVVTYRCCDCTDVWYVELTDDDVEAERSSLNAAREAAQAVVADLRGEVEGIMAAQQRMTPDDEHDVEGASIGFERAKASALLAHASDRLAQLDAAIKRWADGTYGTCERCGAPIGDDRLAALPATARCVTCATLA